VRNANRIDLERLAGICTLELVAALKAKARIMRAFSWAALGKDCIRMRQYRAERDVVQETLFGVFSEKGGLKCDGGRQENCTKAFKWLGSENSRGGACHKLIRAVVRI